MSPTALGAAFVTCLGAGVADLTLLNLAIVPQLQGAEPASQESTPRRAAPDEVAPRAVALTESAPAPAAPPAAVLPRPEPDASDAASALTLLTMLEFDVSSHRLNSSARLRLEQHLAHLRGAGRIVVVGHADATGPAELNDRLSELRAEAAVRQLVERGVALAHIESAARGQREPLPQGNSRRVEIYVGGEP